MPAPRSPIKWFGGKSLLADEIIRRIPPHRCYVEMFGGAGWVLFRKPRSKSEIYNDINGDLVNLFTVLRDRLSEFTERAQWVLPARDGFMAARNEPREDLDPVERALRFYMLVHYSFNVNLRQFKPIITRAPPSVNIDLMRVASERLQKVWIERMDFEELVKKYDSPDTFFYCDPPYAPLSFSSGVYGWKDEEHDRFKTVLSQAKGRFLISYPDWPRFRTLWADHHIEPVVTRYRSCAGNSRGKHRAGPELFISNYDTAAVIQMSRAPHFPPSNPEEVVVDPDAFA